jgi:hypothetical protein
MATGMKMLIMDFFKIPVFVSPAVVAVILLVCMAVSLLVPSKTAHSRS